MDHGDERRDEHGLADDILARAPTVSIPMAPGWDSLNVAAASAVVLHELTQGRTPPWPA